MADNNVIDFLKAWDLAKYIDIFRGKYAYNIKPTTYFRTVLSY